MFFGHIFRKLGYISSFSGPEAHSATYCQRVHTSAFAPVVTVESEILCLFGLSFCFVATVRYKFLCWSDLSYCFVATVRCEFLCWFGLNFCFEATVRCKFLCWFDPSLCFVATVGCLFCEYLCWIDLKLIGKCCLCLSQVEEVASGTARLPWPMTPWGEFKQSQRK